MSFTGRGCHGAYPHLGQDPIVTACEAVLSLQQFVSREVDPTEPAVLTVGQVRAGTADNIIPDTATIDGTVRTLSEAVRRQARAGAGAPVPGIAAAGDCRAEFEWIDGYPPTMNDPAMTEYVARVATATLGADRFFPVARPSMGGEDFAYYLEKVPGCFFFVGREPPDRDGYPPLHSDRYDFTDEALAVGMRMFVELR